LQAYVSFARQLGAVWLERNMFTFIRHLLCDIAAVPGRAANAAASTTQSVQQHTLPLSGAHLEAVYIRRCVMFVLDMTIGRMLSEKAQTDACKEYGMVVAECMNAIGESTACRC
jgi:hypothetical protein